MMYAACCQAELQFQSLLCKLGPAIAVHSAAPGTDGVPAGAVYRLAVLREGSAVVTIRYLRSDYFGLDRSDPQLPKWKPLFGEGPGSTANAAAATAAATAAKGKRARVHDPMVRTLDNEWEVPKSGPGRDETRAWQWQRWR